jgi:hypothetical protein
MKKKRKAIEKRRSFKWSARAREIVSDGLKTHEFKLRPVVTQLTEITGYPRSACRRFARRMGFKYRIPHRHWPAPDRQRLLEILDKYSVAEAAHRMRCTKASIYSLLRRLKFNSSSRKDFYSLRQAAAMLHIRKEQVDTWIKKGWLHATTVQGDKIKRTMIKPLELARFCREHREEIIGNRLHMERLNFLCEFLYPPDHNRLLGVRQSKKERDAVKDSDKDESEEDGEDAGD